jgi:hypothetical protein
MQSVSITTNVVSSNPGFSKTWNSCVSCEGKNTFNTKTSFLGYVNMSCLILEWVRVRIMAFSATFNNISVISWRSVYGGGRECILIGFTTVYAISVYHHKRCEFESRS